MLSVDENGARSSKVRNMTRAREDDCLRRHTKRRPRPCLSTAGRVLGHDTPRGMYGRVKPRASRSDSLSLETCRTADTTRRVEL